MHQYYSQSSNPSDKPWALITGASDGIGKIQAMQLAKYGFNLILVSRSQEKLEDVKSLCQKLAPEGTQIQLKTLDFSKAEIADY